MAPGGRDGSEGDDAGADAEVVTLLRAQRDLRAFEPLYRRYYRPVFDYCYRRLGDHERAADASSQVFTKALAGIHGFRSGSVAAWLFTIARNTVIDAVRTHRPHLTLSDAPVIADSAAAPDVAVIAGDRQRLLYQALGRLTADQRAIVELRWVGLTGPEIAGTLGLSLAAVKSGQYRAYARLRTLLAREDLLGDVS